MTDSESRREARVLCLGNELVCDDGVGIRVGRILRALPLPAGVTVELRRALGLGLIDELAPGIELIIIDASRTGAPPGTVHIMDLSTTAAFSSNPYCCHGVGVAEVLRLAERLDPATLPLRTVVIGVEASQLDEYGLELTPTVQEAIPAAVEAVLRALGATEDLVARGRQEATLKKGIVPTIEEVIE
jgi:hydrogenase maturation protease